MHRLLVLCASVCALALPVACARNAPDVVLVHGQLFGRSPSDSALALRGDRIVATGTDEAILETAGPATAIYDLHNRIVLPGFNDAHFHWMPKPAGEELRLAADPDWTDVLTAVAAAAARVPRTTWLYATVGSSVANDAGASRITLDRAAPEHPVWVWCNSGHGLVLNTAAFRALGLRDEEPDSVDLHYDRLPGTKRLSGRFFEYEHWVQNRRLAALATRDQKLASLRAMAGDAVRFGLTTMQVMSTTTAEELAGLAKDARLPIRVRVIDYTVPGSASWTAGPARSRHDDFGALTRVSGLKWVLDGTPIERGAALRASYADEPGQHGRIDLDPAKLRAVVERAFASADQTLFHVAGDRAAAALFEAMNAVAPAERWKPKRVRVEHGDGIAPDLLPEAVRLGVVVVQNPAHFDLKDLIAERIGPEARIQPLRSLAAAGVPIAIGSDGPMNPYVNLMFAASHPDNPPEALPLNQAIDAYTRGSAFAEFAEGAKGTLAPGQLADITVPSDDIFRIPSQALPRVHSVLTLVGGRVVFDERSLPRTTASHSR